MNNNYSKVHSSWNADRVGNCFQAGKVRVCKPRTRYLYAERRGNTVSVCNGRGKKLFTVAFGEEVLSAIMKDGCLVVTTADTCVRMYSALTGKLLTESWPTPPAGGGLSRTAFDLAA